MKLKSVHPSVDEIKQLLKQVKDPEVPVLDIEELGVLRSVSFQNETFLVTITPTYSGCPAMNVIEQQIKKTLVQNNIENFEVNTILSPAWTTDWMTDEAKQKLIAYGIAAPTTSAEQHLKNLIEGKSKQAQCPFCKSTNTKLTSAFGSTACKGLHYCNNCLQPFEEFKCH